MDEPNQADQPSTSEVGEQMLVTDATRRKFELVFNTADGTYRVLRQPKRHASLHIKTVEMRDDDPDIDTLVAEVVEVMDTLAFVRDQLIQRKPINVASFLSECEHGLRDAMRSSQ